MQGILTVTIEILDIASQVLGALCWIEGENLIG